MTATKTTSKETLQEILAKLDITDDANWTEDGAPALDIVQGLASDETITRDDINAAAPGFIRQVGERAEGVTKNTTVVKAPKVSKSIVDRKFTDDEMREILDRRVNEAEENLLNAQKAASEANQEVARCTARLQRAHVDKERQFPKITAAANIKQHLASQQRERIKAAGLDPDAPGVTSSRPQIDITMERNTRRPGTGQARPTRPVMDGRIVTAA